MYHCLSTGPQHLVVGSGPTHYRLWSVVCRWLRTWPGISTVQTVGADPIGSLKSLRDWADTNGRESQANLTSSGLPRTGRKYSLAMESPPPASCRSKSPRDTNPSDPACLRGQEPAGQLAWSRGLLRRASLCSGEGDLVRQNEFNDRDTTVRL